MNAWVTRIAATCGIVAGAAIAACTVSTTNGPVDVSDSGTSGGDDSGTTGDDAGGGGDTGGGSCAAIGNQSGALVTFGADQAGLTCNSCMSGSCCDQTTACFSVKDCSDLYDCVAACDTADSGADAQARLDCRTTCEDPQVHSADVVAKYQAFEQCYINSCRNSQQCP